MDPWEYLLDRGWEDDPASVLVALKLALLNGPDELDESQLSAAAGVELVTTRRLWRAMGFPDVAPDTRAFTRADLDALHRLGAALASRGDETVIEHARVLSSLLARGADVVATSLTDDIAGYRGAGLAGADAAAAAVVQVRVLEISALFDYLFRRQLVTALARQLTATDEVRGSAQRSAAVIFADLVGFTKLSQQLDGDELALLVRRFQSSAFDLVARRGGRIVKTLGDEIMVVCEDPHAALGIATALAKSYADDTLLPDIRVGMAYGPVLAVQGDYFGPTVNLASRLVGVAPPGGVVISDPARRALGAESQVQMTDLGRRQLKGIGWTAVWIVEPTGASETSHAALEGFYTALLDDDPEELYERAPCGYLSTTPDGTIVKVNQTFLAWTGYVRDELVGERRFMDLLTGGGRIYHETHYAPMLRMQGLVREIALDIVGASGQRMPALVNAVMERDAAGAPVVVRVAVFDATERREYERELLRAKQRAEQSEAEARLLARTLQQTLIPPALPAIPGLDIAAMYRPAGSGEQVGGDFYDVIELGVDDWLIVVGDVCGKGVEAAVVTALARYTIWSVAVHESRPRHILHELNEVLLRHGTERFCTVILARIRRIGGSWNLTVCSGGHPLPVLGRAGLPPEPIGEPGALLGVFDTPALHDQQRPMEPGDHLVLYTDGVSEGRRGVEFYGEHRLHAAISSGGSARDVSERILHGVLDFQGETPADDIAIIVVHVPKDSA